MEQGKMKEIGYKEQHPFHATKFPPPKERLWLEAFEDAPVEVRRWSKNNDNSGFTRTQWQMLRVMDAQSDTVIWNCKLGGEKEEGAKDSRDW